MEKAYQDALQHPNGYDRPALIRAQNQWLRYRRAACDFYAKQDGTIAYIESAYCMLDLTRRRALELEKIPEI